MKLKPRSKSSLLTAKPGEGRFEAITSQQLADVLAQGLILLTLKSLQGFIEVFMQNRIKLVLIASLLLTCLVGLLDVYKAKAQRGPLAFGISQGKDNPQGAQGSADTQDRVIEKRSNSAFPNEPVDITAVRTKKTNRRFGEKFQGDDEWIQGLTIRVKNISSKNVTYINVRISFERPEKSENAAEPTFVHSLVFGSNPAISERSRSLAPGSSIEVGLPDRSYAALKVALRNVGYPANISRLRLYLTQVLFDDDTMWANGYWFRRDPAFRDNWIPVEKDGEVLPGILNTDNGNPFSKTSFSASTVRIMSPLSGLQSCGKPGVPYLQTCAGSAPDCKKEVTPVLSGASAVFYPPG